MQKVSSQKLWIKLVIFMVGMFSVSIAGMFGGYYSTAIASMLLMTIYAYNFLDDIGENLVPSVLIAVVTFFQLLFFVVNDIFNVPAYTRNNFNFMSILVMLSQTISVGALVYELSFVFRNFISREPHVELVHGESDSVEECAEETEKYESETFENEEDNEKETEIKYISHNAQDEVPFMEEE